MNLSTSEAEVWTWRCLSSAAAQVSNEPYSKIQEDGTIFNDIIIIRFSSMILRAEQVPLKIHQKASLKFFAQL